MVNRNVNRDIFKKTQNIIINVNFIETPAEKFTDTETRKLIKIKNKTLRKAKAIIKCYFISRFRYSLK